MAEGGSAVVFGVLLGFVSVTAWIIVFGELSGWWNVL